MICDDYEWMPALPVTERPKEGFNSFLHGIEGDYTILHKGYQIIIEKTSPVPKKILPKNNASLQLTIRGQVVPGITPPLISFVLVNWNYGRYIGAAIDSIIAQDYPHFECIVVDNCSTDDSLEVF